MNNLFFDFTVNKETKTVHIVREFNAGLDLVWQAWTTAEMLDQWWAPLPFKSRTKDMNFEPGGRRLYAMVSPEGNEHYAMHMYKSISPKTNFTMSNNFADANGNPDVPGSDWDLTFTEENGTTKVSIRIYNKSLERMERMIEMGFKEGFTATLDYLDNMLSKK